MYETSRSNHSQEEKEEKDEGVIGLKPQKTPPISVDNEKKMLAVVNKLCAKALSLYRTSLKVLFFLFYFGKIGV